MSRLRSLYHVQELRAVEENEWHAEVDLDKDHAVYAGHFPGRPVTPGVVQIQLVEHIIHQALGKRMVLRSARSIKFLQPVDPFVDGRMSYRIVLNEKAEGLGCDATATVNGTTVFTMKAVFTEVG